MLACSDYICAQLLQRVGEDIVVVVVVIVRIHGVCTLLRHNDFARGVNILFVVVVVVVFAVFVVFFVVVVVVAIQGYMCEFLYDIYNFVEL